MGWDNFRTEEYIESHKLVANAETCDASRNDRCDTRLRHESRAEKRRLVAFETNWAGQLLQLRHQPNAFFGKTTAFQSRDIYVSGNSKFSLPEYDFSHAI
jgi:hypothetical protein